MGTLLAFPTAPRPRRASAAADEPRGQILLFTGVRYERSTTGAGPQDDDRRTPPRSSARRG
jgi:hypothetical protein